MTRLSCWFRNHKDRNGKRYSWEAILSPANYADDTLGNIEPPEKCSHCGCTRH